MRTRRHARTALRFHRWLLAFPSGAVVATDRTASACPLACWLNDGMTENTAIVGYHEWREGEDERLRMMPAWARRFVEIVDHGRGPVTLEEAYAAMATVLAERHGSVR